MYMKSNTTAFLAIAAIYGALTASAGIRWQTTTVTSGFPAAALTDHLTNPLPTDPGAGSVSGTGAYDGLGCFVQLIWAGPNGQIDPVGNGFVAGVSNGTEGTDDRIIDTAFIGLGRPGEVGSATNPLGHIVNQTGPEVSVANGGGSTGQSYYIRAFNAPVESGRNFSDSFFTPIVGGGLAPGILTTRYGNSALFTTSDANEGVNEVFTAAPFATNILLVPEAGTAGLAGLGMLVLRRFLRRKNA